MADNPQIQLKQLKTALNAVIEQWMENSQNNQMSKARRSISREHANVIKRIITEVETLTEEDDDEYIYTIVLGSLSEAMLTELDRFQSEFPSP